MGSVLARSSGVCIGVAILVVACSGRPQAGQTGDTSGEASTATTSSSGGEDTTGSPGETGSGNEGSESGESTDSDDCGDMFVGTCDDLPPAPCDPGLQDCPEGEKCTAYVTTPGYCCADANKCVPVVGDKQFGEACTRTEDNDDCAKGLFCMTKTSGDTGEGVCLQFCDITDPDSCAGHGLPQAVCLAYGDGVLPLCVDHCDPLADECPEPLGCYPVGAQGFICILPGNDDGKGNDDDDCSMVASCKPGLFCADTKIQDNCQTNACCTPFCSLSGDGSECVDPDETCIPYFEPNMAPPGYEDVGFCGLA